jgi:hypothetical protein
VVYCGTLTWAQVHGHLRDLLAACQIRKVDTTGPLAIVVADPLDRCAGRVPESVALSLPKAVIGQHFACSAAVLIAPCVPSGLPIPTPDRPNACFCMYPCTHY